MLIVINGFPGAGKDTFVEFCRIHYQNIQSFSTIDAVKGFAKELGWDGVKDEKGRNFLAAIKTSWTEYNDGPFKMVKSMVQSVIDYDRKCIVFVHCREPKEIQKLINCFPQSKSLLINRVVENVASNHADQKVNSFDYDIIIDNDRDLNFLNEQSKHFLIELGFIK